MRTKKKIPETFNFSVKYNAWNLNYKHDYVLLLHSFSKDSTALKSERRARPAHQLGASCRMACVVALWV